MPFAADQIPLFLAVLDAGSFSAAARKLGRVPSAVSMAIAQLEAELDLQLFDRRGREPVPTAAARALEPQARLLAEQLRQLKPVTLKVPPLVVKGGVKGPAVLRVHINETGKVSKTALLESCGNADLDEAAMHAAREMEFKPYTVAGVPTEVTLVLPMHVPKRFGRTD